MEHGFGMRRYALDLGRLGSVACGDLILVRRNEMGEWSEYFEDFPEENSANYDERGRYCAPNSPEGYQLAQSRRIQAANQARTAELNAEIHAIIAKHKKQ